MVSETNTTLSVPTSGKNMEIFGLNANFANRLNQTI